MDVGDSLNPAIDIGQIEGAFTQGLGLFTLEELRYTPTGTLLTRGPGMYKIPGGTSIIVCRLLKKCSLPSLTANHFLAEKLSQSKISSF